MDQIQSIDDMFLEQRRYCSGAEPMGHPGKPSKKDISLRMCELTSGVSASETLALVLDVVPLQLGQRTWNVPDPHPPADLAPEVIVAQLLSFDPASPTEPF